MTVVFTCPNCGADLEGGQLLSDPPVPFMRCPECEFIWYGRVPKDQLRIPLLPSTPYDWNTSGEYIPEFCRNCGNHPSNGGSGICNCVLPYFGQGGVTC